MWLMDLGMSVFLFECTNLLMYDTQDYQAAVEEAKRKFEEDLMVNWIVDNVEKAITPQQEKENLALCIKNLESLSKTASL